MITDEFKLINNDNSSSLDNTGISSHRTITLYCGQCGEPVTVKLKCSDRTCPECRRRTYFKLLKGWLELVKPMVNPKLLTLTIKNKSYLDKKDIKFIRKCFNKFLRKKYYKRRIKGGLYVIEITNKGRGWNIHIHALIEASSKKEEYLPQQKISRDWLQLTGDSPIVDIRKTHTPKKGLKYILKYFFKPPKVNGKEEVYNRVLKKSRLIQPFGDLYGNKLLKSKLKCKKCGNDSWIIEFELEKELKDFRLNRSGYSGLKLN
jgi:hypothetical protein